MQVIRMAPPTTHAVITIDSVSVYHNVIIISIITVVQGGPKISHLPRNLRELGKN